MLYSTALPIAQSIAKSLADHCIKIQIAGSLRRQCAHVGDIEIICVPRTEIVPDADLFATVKTKIRSRLFIKTLVTTGNVEKGSPEGRYIRITHPSGISIDVFMTSRSDFYRQYAIRTGSADYCKIIARAWVALGWVGTSDGLRSRKQCHQVNNRWICKADNPKKPPVWQSEEEFFTWLKLPFIHPILRS